HPPDGGLAQLVKSASPLRPDEDRGERVALLRLNLQGPGGSLAPPRRVEVLMARASPSAVGASWPWGPDRLESGLRFKDLEMPGGRGVANLLFSSNENARRD